MHDFVRAALLGLGRESADLPHTGTPVDALVADGDRERAFLLRAAARELYLRAGLVPRTFAGEHDVAPAESLRACSPRLIELLVDHFDGDADVARSIGDALAAAKLHLPHRLLPEALSVRDAAARAELAPVIGARGRWLAKRNTAWRWALGTADADGDVVTRWEEGTAEQRVEALRELRAADAAAARARLEEVWSKEKAEVRAALLGALSVAIARDDEPFLEKARADRSSNVRGVAEELLVRLPESMFVARMLERANETVRKAQAPSSMWEKVKSGFGAKTLKLIVEPPAAEGSGARAAALAQIVGAVPLAYWTRTFSATPEELLDAARATDWLDALVEGWSAAAARQHDEAWAAMLLARAAKTLTQEQKFAIAGAAPSGHVMSILVHASATDWPLARMLALLPLPWPHAFAREWLARLKRAAGNRADTTAHALFATLEQTARALPLSLHDEAVAGWSNDANAWRGDWDRRIEKLIRIVRIRKSIAEESAS